MKKIIYLMLTLLIAGAASIHAQVAISPAGVPLTAPHQGTLLDLQNGNQDLGLKLPTIALSDVDVYQLNGLTDDATKKSSTGMLIYNTNENVLGGQGKGLYTWDGCAWVRIFDATDNSQKLVITDDRYGTTNVYSIGDFGDDAGIWMTENLREVPKTNPIIGAGSTFLTQWYNYPNSNSANVAAYGYLYTWTAAMNVLDSSPGSGDTGYWLNQNNGNSTTNGTGTATEYISDDGVNGRVRGICPDGWHLPTDYEWSLLEKAIAEDGNQLYSGIAGTTTGFETLGSGAFGTTNYRGDDPAVSRLDWKMKTAKMPSATSCTTAFDSGKSRSSTGNGFNALPAGNGTGSSPLNFGASARFWSSSSYSDLNAWYRRLDSDAAGSYRNRSGKYFQFSVRCKKN